MGDLADYLRIKFDEQLSSLFFHELDNLSSIEESDWTKDNEKYKFSITLGMGCLHLGEKTIMRIGLYR